MERQYHAGSGLAGVLTKQRMLDLFGGVRPYAQEKPEEPSPPLLSTLQQAAEFLLVAMRMK
jgi:hypothetical protein